LYGPVKDWSTDHQYEYIQKIKKAKEKIDDNKIKVLPPKVIVNGKEVDQGIKIEYSEKIDIQIELAKEDVFVYITEDGSDPTKKSPNRKKITTNELIEIKGNKKIKYVSVDKDGNYGYVNEINLIDKDNEYVIKGEKDLLGDIIIPFKFPKNQQQLKVFLNSYLNKVIDLDVATKNQIEKILKEIL